LFPFSSVPLKEIPGQRCLFHTALYKTPTGR
jgi:hypothetical protein